MIAVVMEDLAKADRKELERELEEEMAERHQRKLACFQKTRNGVMLACFQKTRNGVVKKADTSAAS
jgi:hypothetical protein